MNGIQTYFSKRWVGLGAITVLSLLVVLSFFQLGSFWQMMHVAAVDLRHAGASESVAVTQTMPVRLASLHLFGEVREKSAVLPGTHLDLELTGVVEAIPVSFSRAIITEAGGVPRVVGIGDVLAGSGARVEAIHRSSVVLDNGGHLEKLLLQRMPLVFGDRPASLPEGS